MIESQPGCLPSIFHRPPEDPRVGQYADELEKAGIRIERKPTVRADLHARIGQSLPPDISPSAKQAIEKSLARPLEAGIYTDNFRSHTERRAVREGLSPGAKELYQETNGLRLNMIQSLVSAWRVLNRSGKIQESKELDDRINKLIQDTKTYDPDSLDSLGEKLHNAQQAAEIAEEIIYHISGKKRENLFMLRAKIGLMAVGTLAVADMAWNEGQGVKAVFEFLVTEFPHLVNTVQKLLESFSQ